MKKLIFALVACSIGTLAMAGQRPPPHPTVVPAPAPTPDCGCGGGSTGQPTMGPHPHTIISDPNFT